MERKDMEWDANFMRNVIAPNIYELSQLKRDWRKGSGLAEKRGNHPEPHSNPELRILLDAFSREELHQFRQGRQYNTAAKQPPVYDTFGRGFELLSAGKLEQWVTSSIRVRDVAQTNAAAIVGRDESESEDEGADKEGDMEHESHRQTQGNVSRTERGLEIEFENNEGAITAEDIQAAEYELDNEADSEDELF